MWVARGASFPHVLTNPYIDVLQGGGDVGGPSASKRAAVDRCYDDRGCIRNDIGVDAKREYQGILEGTSGLRSVGTCAFFIQDPVPFTLGSLMIGCFS